MAQKTTKSRSRAKTGSSREAKKLLLNIVTSRAADFDAWLDAIDDPHKKVTVYLKLLEFALPKKPEPDLPPATDIRSFQVIPASSRNKADE